MFLFCFFFYHSIIYTIRNAICAIDTVYRDSVSNADENRSNGARIRKKLTRQQNGRSSNYRNSNYRPEKKMFCSFVSNMLKNLCFILRCSISPCTYHFYCSNVLNLLRVLQLVVPLKNFYPQFFVRICLIVIT